MEIRARRDADLESCERLAAQVHARDGYPPRYADDLAALFTRPTPIAAWVAVDGDDVVGHVALHDRTTAAAMTLATEVTGQPAADLVVLARLLVAPSARRRGIGRTLLDVAVTAAHDRGRRPTAIRRAIIARDRHCQWPGCEMPHPWCDAHHFQRWEHGGETRSDNGLLLRRRHHTFLHTRSDWSASFDAQQFRVFRPDGSEVHRDPWTDMDWAA